MKFDRQAMQGQLDLAADELEKAGFADLAEKVDYYNDRLLQANLSEIPLIKRALSRVQIEAKKRLKAISTEKKPDKGKEAVLKARRSSESRKETLRRRLKTIAANRKKAAERLAALRDDRRNRQDRKAERRNTRKKRISEKE